MNISLWCSKTLAIILSLSVLLISLWISTGLVLSTFGLTSESLWTRNWLLIMNGSLLWHDPLSMLYWLAAISTSISAIICFTSVRTKIHHRWNILAVICLVLAVIACLTTGIWMATRPPSDLGYHDITLRQWKAMSNETKNTFQKEHDCCGFDNFRDDPYVDGDHCPPLEWPEPLHAPRGCRMALEDLFVLVWRVSLSLFFVECLLLLVLALIVLSLRRQKKRMLRNAIERTEYAYEPINDDDLYTEIK